MFLAESIFVSNNVAPISSDGREPLHIPCPVAEPNFATVTLVKEVNEVSLKFQFLNIFLWQFQVSLIYF